MALSIVSRGLLRTSKDILDRNMTVGAVTIFNGLLDVDIRCSSFLPERIMSTKPAALLSSMSTLQNGTPPRVLQKWQNKTAFVCDARQYSSKKYHQNAKNERQCGSDSDSDDEFERKRQKADLKMSEKGDSEFWRRKMRTLHRILDVNRDGVVSFDDFNLLAKRFTDLGHLSPELSEEFREVIKETWIELFGEIRQYNLVTAEQFLTDLHHRLNDKQMAKRVGRFLPYLFKAVDYDHSGYLDLDQYKILFRCLGLTDEDAAISFAVIDKNGDGHLTMKDFNHLGRQFLITEDETKISKMFWGPLIDH